MNNSMLTRSIVITTLVLVAQGLSLAPAAEHTKDSLTTVKKNIEDKKAVLVDVREKSEWEAGHIEGAVLLPSSELKAGIDKERLAKQLPKDKIVYTHCAAGKRSLSACDILQKLGYEVRPLKPGYQDLLKSGFNKAKE
jgi:rhodanese-related sulfurtransferase